MLTCIDWLLNVFHITTFKNSAFVERIGADALRQYRLPDEDDSHEKEGWELHERRNLIHQQPPCVPERNRSRGPPLKTVPQ